MRTKGRTSSWGGGASMTTARPVRLCRRKYRRNEASPASNRSSASPQPAPQTKSARCLRRSEPAKPLISLQVGLPACAFDGKAHREPFLGQQAAEALGPFDQGDTLGPRFLPAQLEDLLGRLQAVEVKMPEDAARRIVDFDQGEGRAWHDQRRIPRGGAQNGPCQRRLAGAQAALQGNDVARPKTPGERGAQALGCSFVRQEERMGRHPMSSMPTLN